MKVKCEIHISLWSFDEKDITDFLEWLNRRLMFDRRDHTVTYTVRFIYGEEGKKED